MISKLFKVSMLLILLQASYAGQLITSAIEYKTYPEKKQTYTLASLSTEHKQIQNFEPIMSYRLFNYSQLSTINYSPTLRFQDSKYRLWGLVNISTYNTIFTSANEIFVKDTNNDTESVFMPRYINKDGKTRDFNISAHITGNSLDIAINDQQLFILALDDKNTETAGIVWRYPLPPLQGEKGPIQTKETVIFETKPENCPEDAKVSHIASDKIGNIYVSFTHYSADYVGEYTINEAGIAHLKQSYQLDRKEIGHVEWFDVSSDTPYVHTFYYFRAPKLQTYAFTHDSNIPKHVSKLDDAIFIAASPTQTFKTSCGSDYYNTRNIASICDITQYDGTGTSLTNPNVLYTHNDTIERGYVGTNGLIYVK